jgi:imidazolonepropionase
VEATTRGEAMAVTILAGATQVVTCEMMDERAVRDGVGVAVEGGRIVAVAPEAELARRFRGAERVDCGGGVLTPGLVDSHTHAVFGRWRADEYALRSRGVPYMEIARRGGGINASVRDLRERSEDELVELTRARLRPMLEHGTTTAEVKSGYGLTTDDELKMLRVIRRLDAEGPLELVPTFLGGHEVPPEFAGRRDEYVDLVVNEMIPAVAAERLARFCDVFMEPGVFNADQSRRILQAGLDYGLVPKIHADELEWSGGAELAGEMGAASADHLGRVSDEGLAALVRSGTVATLLPGTLFFLGRKEYAPARRLIDAGATVALASDFNPGSCATPSLPLIMTIACSQMRMDPLEALVAATRNGARALRIDDGRGTLAFGAPADIVLWDAQDYREIPYRYGVRLAKRVWKRGREVA